MYKPGKGRGAEMSSEVGAYLDSIIALMPGHVYWKNREGVYLGCNEEQALSAGLKGKEEMIGLTDADLPWNRGKPELVKRLQEIDCYVIETGKPYNVEEPGPTKNGEETVFLSKKAPLYDAKGSIVGIVGVSFNITDRKKAEALQREVEVTNEKNKYLKTIGGSISHELRTPLVGIRGGLQAVEKFHPPLIETYLEAKEAGRAKGELELEASQLGLLEQVIKNMLNQTTNAFHIIDMQLKNMSVDSIEKDKFEEHTMSDIIELALAEYPFKDAEEGNIQVQTENDFKFIGDKTLTKHILWNLLKNALYYIKAARKGEVLIWLDSDERYNKLHFKDTAQGMPAEVAEKVFQQFFTQRATGTGLGLAFCKLVMEAYGGNIACQSVEGEYAEFILFFPKV